MEKNNKNIFDFRFSIFDLADVRRNLESTARGGMTLVETVLALAILSIGIFILVETTAKCIAVVRMARNYQTARAILDRGESEHPLRGTNSVEDNTVEPVDYDGYVFSRDLQPVDGEKKLFTVITKVSWSETGKASGEELVSYVYCPNEE
jgi:type II secretory pathway pseudopilin PulG